MREAILQLISRTWTMQGLPAIATKEDRILLALVCCYAVAVLSAVFTRRLIIPVLYRLRILRRRKEYKIFWN
jgi:hypothetical protein